MKTGRLSLRATSRCVHKQVACALPCVLQRVAVCVAARCRVCCSALPCAAMRCKSGCEMLQCVLQRVAVWVLYVAEVQSCSVLQRVAACCNVLQRVAVCVAVRCRVAARCAQADYD